MVYAFYDNGMVFRNIVCRDDNKVIVYEARHIFKVSISIIKSINIQNICNLQVVYSPCYCSVPILEALIPSMSVIAMLFMHCILVLHIVLFTVADQKVINNLESQEALIYLAAIS